MEYISIDFVYNNVIKQYGKQKALKAKINNYFNSFVNTHQDIAYFWVDDKAYVADTFAFQMKKEIERLLNKRIRPIQTKVFPRERNIEAKDSTYIREKIEERKRKIKEKADAKKAKVKAKFKHAIRNIKDGVDGFRCVGVFDLEFWEKDMDILLEFGWSITDYNGTTTTTHLIVQENLRYENGIFSKNNRFARKDTQIVPLKIAKKRFKEEFLDKIDLLIGHGLENDFKVLEANGIILNEDYLDTSEIGAAIMDEDHKVGLERLLNYLEIKHEKLHNAANDVEYLLQAFFKMGDL